MLPAYHVSPSDLMEVVHSVAVLGPDANEEDVIEFSNVNDERAVKEALKTACEINLIEDDDAYTVPDKYTDQIRGVEFEDRDIVLSSALLDYRPFRNFLSFVDHGYSTFSAAKKVNVLYNIGHDESVVKGNFERLGEYAQLLDTVPKFPEVNAEPDQLPRSSTNSIDNLREGLKSETGIVLYLEDTLGEPLVTGLDDGIEEELIDAFNKHADDPRDSITAAGRALEDYLRQVARDHGSPSRDYQNASGIGQVANHLKGDKLIKEVQKKRALSIGTIRNKGGGHGKDQRTNQRWRVSSDIALTTALETTLLMRSVHESIKNSSQVL